jgi:SsrA-binding protein
VRKIVAQNKKARTTTRSTTSTRPASCSPAPRSSRCARAAARSPTASPTCATARCGCSASTSRSTPRARGPTTRPRRARKLLLHKGEILRLIGKTREGGVSLVPLQLYFSGGRAKVEIALARGRKAHDKRQVLAERDAQKEIRNAMGRALKGRR